MSSIAVIGETGQLAQSFKRCLGNKAIYLGRSRFNAEKNLNGLIDELKSLSPSAIINSAAFTDVEAAESQPESLAKLNQVLPSSLAQLAHQLKIPFFHYSTDYVFDGSKNGAYLETDHCSPLNQYGRSKLSGEQDLLKEDPKAFVFRTSWVYSPWGRNFVNTMLALAKTHPQLNIVNDQLGSPTSALELAKSSLKILSHIQKTGDFQGGVFHLTAAGQCSWAEFALEIFDQAFTMGLIETKPLVKKISSHEYPQKAKRPLNSLLNCDKVSKQFGIDLINWKESLRECLEILDES